ncbi:hypothetical protein PoB_001590000 [Plakobranchus ocellatus]|uniref:Uncharacterized protein n=1 Tax=Plakobranchus ocellatus TaxID=259542 RepID=A0AAV3Z442_9GAST|nr:hypothetical protein PoB_001590000 [Plakobranchus ocellatus]
MTRRSEAQVWVEEHDRQCLSQTRHLRREEVSQCSDRSVSTASRPLTGIPFHWPASLSDGASSLGQAVWASDGECGGRGGTSEIFAQDEGDRFQWPSS